jgi:alpha-ketoglutarate-dependent taurine dioxygenase
MVNYHFHENGWTVILDDVDFKTVTQEDINHIAKLLSVHTCVVIRGQDLTLEEEVRVLKMWKDPYDFHPDIKKEEAGYKDTIVPGSEDYIIRVTAALDENGNPGFAGMTEELQWHCNDATRAERRSITWLYGVHGTAGSRTSWNNNVASYRDLTQEQKDKLADIKLNMCHWTDRDPGRDAFTPNLVHTNIAGVTGLFFPFLQILNIVGMTEKESAEWMKPLVEHTTQEKYMYHHDWVDGDIVISEQWLGIHRRWPFPDMANRLLHRAVFDFPDQDYK